jgi:hypothetical protein
MLLLPLFNKQIKFTGWSDVILTVTKSIQYVNVSTLY